MLLLSTLRRLVSVLVVLGMFVSAMGYAMPTATGQVIVVAGPAQDVGMPCGMMVGMHGVDSKARGESPCNTITPDCVKKMVCLQAAALPGRGGLDVGPVTFSRVSYRVTEFVHSGLTHEPELSPPLTA